MPKKKPEKKKPAKKKVYQKKLSLYPMTVDKLLDVVFKKGGK